MANPSPATDAATPWWRGLNRDGVIINELGGLSAAGNQGDDKQREQAKGRMGKQRFNRRDVTLYL